MSLRAKIVVAVALAVSMMGLLGLRLAHIQSRALAEGREAVEAGREDEAIDVFRRAIRAHHPFSRITYEAAGELIGIAEEAESRGDVQVARLAYASALGALNAVTVYGVAPHAVVKDAERGLVRVRGGEPLPRGPEPARPLGKLGVGLGLLLVLFAGYRMLTPFGVQTTRRVILDVSFFFAGMAVFVVSALYA